MYEHQSVPHTHRVEYTQAGHISLKERALDEINVTRVKILQGANQSFNRDGK